MQNVPSSAGVPGPPFMPLSSSKFDPHDAPSACPGLDRVGAAMLKTMNVVCDERFVQFFSKRGVDTVQDGLARRVHAESGYVIDRQSDEKLLLLMRQVYLANVYADQATWVEKAVRAAAANVISNISYANIHLKIKDASFQPIAYGVSDTSSIRGLVA